MSGNGIGGAFALLALAGCGSEDGRYGPAATSVEAATAPPGADSGAAVLTVSRAPKVGAVLVDSGDATGQDANSFGAPWYALTGAGSKATP